MRGDTDSVKAILQEIDSKIFQNNPRFLVELDLILFTSMLKKRQIEQAIYLAQEKLLPVLNSQYPDTGLEQKIKVGLTRK